MTQAVWTLTRAWKLPCFYAETLSFTLPIDLRKRSMALIANRFVREEAGEDLIEYGLLVAFMAAVAMAVIISDPLSLESAVTNAFESCAKALNSI